MHKLYKSNIKTIQDANFNSWNDPFGWHSLQVLEDITPTVLNIAYSGDTIPKWTTWDSVSIPVWRGDKYIGNWHINADKLKDTANLSEYVVGDLRWKESNCMYIPKIKRAIFNAPATIVYWEDGTKTVVKCMDEDTYAEDVGLAMCYMKKLFEKDDYTYMKKDQYGNEHEETAYGYKKVFKKWIDGYGKE